MCDITDPSDVRTAGATPTKSRHVSIRVDRELYDRLEALAHDHGETVSQCARRMLAEGMRAPDPTAAGLDDAIALLESHRRRRTAVADHAGDATSGLPRSPSSTPARPARTVQMLNAKTNLSRLLTDVARGEEIVIAHAGTARARLIPIDRPPDDDLDVAPPSRPTE